MPDQEVIDSLQEQLAKHRERLAHCLKQKAIHGPNYVPPGVESDIKNARSEIRRIKQALRAANVPVEDYPNDEEADTTVASQPGSVGVADLPDNDKRIPQPSVSPRTAPSPQQSQKKWGGIGLLILLVIGTLAYWLVGVARPPQGSVLTTTPPVQPTTLGSVPTQASSAQVCEHDREIKPSDGFGDGIVANVDGSGNLYVADTNNNRILKLPASGTALATWGPSGNASNQIGSPLGLAIDKDGNVYITYSNNEVRKFDSNGKQQSWGEKDVNDKQFDNPTGIAVDSAHGYVYVADTDNNRIQQFDLDGNYKNQWGGADDGDGRFKRPFGVTVDANGNVYVADSGNNRIQKFDSNGTLLPWGNTANHAGKASGQFNDPRGVAVDSTGNVYVADTGNHRIQKFTSSGELVETLDRCGAGNDKFKFPRTVSVDKQGMVYVADSGGKRILIFRPKQ